VNKRQQTKGVTHEEWVTPSAETSALSLKPGIPDSQNVELIGENETGILSPE